MLFKKRKVKAKRVSNEMLNSEALDQFTDRDLSRLKMMLNYLADPKKEEVITLRVFTDEYENFVKVNLSDSYSKSVKIACNYLKEYFSAQKILSQISLRNAEQFMIWLQSKTGNGYRVYYRNIKAALNKAVDWEYIKVNPFKKIKLVKKQRVNPAYINNEQLSVISRQLVVGSGWKENEVVRDVVVTAFYTGMRLNELVNLTWKNVDLDARVITVGDERFTTKGRNQRYIPMSEEVVEILVRRETEDASGKNQDAIDSAFVFCKENGKPFTGDYYSKKFKRACKAASLDPSSKIDKAIHFHSLRHSFASNLAQRGVSLYTIKELLGHSSISTTEIYSHLNMDSLREAVKQLDTSTPLSAGVKGETEDSSTTSSTALRFRSEQGSELRLGTGVKSEREKI